MAKHLPNSRSARRLHRRAAASVASVFVAGLSGCAVGPDFISPPPPDVDRYTPENLSSIDGRRLVVSEDIPRRWWEVFHNRNLNRLIEASIEHNPTLQAANASIRTAYFAAEAQKGGFLPTALLNGKRHPPISSLYGVQNLVTPNASTNPYGLFLRQLSVSYTPDIWGPDRYRALGIHSKRSRTEQRYR